MAGACWRRSNYSGGGQNGLLVTRYAHPLIFAYRTEPRISRYATPLASLLGRTLFDQRYHYTPPRHRATRDHHRLRWLIIRSGLSYHTIVYFGAPRARRRRANLNCQWGSNNELCFHSVTELYWTRMQGTFHGPNMTAYVNGHGIKRFRSTQKCSLYRHL